MSITDELRAWAKGHLSKSSILAIADCIDAEHEKAMSRAGQLLADAERDRDYNYANWQECKQKVLQGNIAFDELYATFDELNARIECLEDELSHRIELPKDADGEHINVGDDMEYANAPHTHAPVEYIALTKDGWEVDGEPPSSMRHHRPDTWKRIIADALGCEVFEVERDDDLMALVARCKALAGGENS